MNVIAVLEPLISRPVFAPGDYVGEDGLCYCGQCRTPKQAHGTGALEGRLLPIPCACRTKEREAEAERDRLREIEALRERCLPNRAMRAHTFAAAGEARHIRLARRYADKWEKVYAENIGLLLWGNTGTGKSFTAHCIANALIDRGVPLRLWSTVELVARLMDREKRDEALDKVRHLPLLILDDVGAERDTPYVREQLCAAIDERAESRKPLIVTTNYSVSEVKGSGDTAMQRIFDRLEAQCVPIAVTGESRRRALGAGKLKAAKELLEIGNEK